ncbi:hypothetical protein GCM10022252_07780 [Streptosporangium oxazolinicum]|uniref:Enolpyruvate transferase domain-containing protein n=1 Tax=Streptosporangium oxazolinicum TaxID=909287 RepID=A0ABP8ADK2_9ACTN
MAERVRVRRLASEEGAEPLRIVCRGEHGSIRVRRAMAVMASASGNTALAIARLVVADDGTAREVIHAFNEVGPAVLDL